MGLRVWGFGFGWFWHACFTWVGDCGFFVCIACSALVQGMGRRKSGVGDCTVGDG